MATKKRLIDANALMDKVDESKYNNPHTIARVRLNHYQEHDHFCKMIYDAPTVDAVEVVHGEWVVCGDGEYVPFLCSACGKTTSWYHAQTANYCPNCGAKMDVERKDNG